ncbi:tRNA (guanine(10)-N(2))-dimethyltransferase [Methanocella sp. CWC-04]|uniref:tRNA (guanine(26)-N(2))-dimethyltransferase n=1 Tax=Methanooceanicella nereidis TaxID=2052831 RepID=A0AAP2W6S9_9EURY|nr:tRNA (guanine(10)-N(2))-dimethyltransferase [Methanocella sp. CWC-04]MCD1295663.1 tRNA (guanine(10)-N(2))-dimethyltransferase [Methanocella sp. CWC-04]
MTSVKEGKVTIEMGEDVFYNPRMEMNRDINVACITALPEVSSYVDAMAASGIRGIRVKKEVPRHIDVTVNDLEVSAYELIMANARNNGVSVNASNMGANTLLSSTQFDFVDIDPFGTPSPYIDSVCRSAKKVMGITATDTAPLCGAHLRSGMRKYEAYPLKTEYHSEMGVRVLLGKVARELAKYDRAFKPYLCHATEHYVRLYLGVEYGVVSADRMLDEVGFIVHCFKCLNRYSIKGLAVQAPERCPVCGSKVQIGGPMWLGRTRDREFVSNVIEIMEKGEFKKKERAIRMLGIIREETEVPTFFDQHRICKDLKATPTDINTLVEALKAEGFSASRTHYSGTGFKTDAPINVVKSIITKFS